MTSLFNYRIQELFAQKGLCMEASGLATFDCRMGSFATMEEVLTFKELQDNHKIACHCHM